MPDREPPHVVAVCGSLREDSHTRKGLKEVLAGAEERGATGELLDLREYDLPPLIPGSEPGDAKAFTGAIREADSVVLGTPMYHGSYSGVLKNAVDYCGFDEFEDTTVGLFCVAGGAFPITALEHLRSVCRALDAWVLPYQAAVPRSRSAFDDEGIADEKLRERVRTLGERVVEYARIEPDPHCFEAEQNVGAGSISDD
ncbi:NADPH-dependent FMN reductase [Natronorarus salvus]|uniref:NADPH-dependent FMN reductase n=1 Tax=Natronorarus salvus TaxID=3117733 RepID=UPI002F2628F7